MNFQALFFGLRNTPVERVHLRGAYAAATAPSTQEALEIALPRLTSLHLSEINVNAQELRIACEQLQDCSIVRLLHVTQVVFDGALRCGGTHTHTYTTLL
jgi:hypothetical protein